MKPEANSPEFRDQDNPLPNRAEAEAEGSARLSSRPTLRDAVRAALPELPPEVAEAAEYDLYAEALRQQHSAEGASLMIPSREEFARMKSAAADLSRRLGVRLNLHSFRDDIKADDPRTQARMRRAYGWYDPQSGEIHINLTACRGVDDVVATILHEVVGHKGLEEFIGLDRFNDFVDTVFRQADSRVRAGIEHLAERKYNGDQNVATREYMARLAEKIETNGLDHANSVMRRIWTSMKSHVERWINAFLRRLGIGGRIRISDRDLSYLLLRVYDDMQARAASSASLQSEAARISRESAYHARQRFDIDKPDPNPDGSPGPRRRSEPREASEATTEFRPLEDKALTEQLDSEPRIQAARAMQVIDGKLYSPMASGRSSALGEPYRLGIYDEATAPSPEIFSDEVISRARELARPGNTGVVEVIPGMLRFEKKSPRGKVSLNYHLKTDHTDVWAAYNPYNHQSNSLLNDQFKAYHRRGNLVTVLVEVPLSDLNSGSRAPFAKNSVGVVSWKSGDVGTQLPEELRRQVYLSRYSKPIRVLTNAEVADWTMRNLRKAEEILGHPVRLPYEVFHPEVRKIMERNGFKFADPKPSKARKEEILEEDADYMTDEKIRAFNEASGVIAEWTEQSSLGQAYPVRGAADYTGRNLPELEFRDADRDEWEVPRGDTARERLLDLVAQMAGKHSDNLQFRSAAVNGLGSALRDLNKAMRAQKRYDVDTLHQFVKLVNIMRGNMLLPDSAATSGEITKILSAVKHSTDNDNAVDNAVTRLSELVADTQVKNAETYLQRLLSLKGKRLNPSGVEVQGELDVEGQVIAEVVKEHKRTHPDMFDRMESDLQEIIASGDDARAREAEFKLQGLDYARRLSEARTAYDDAMYELKLALEDHKAGYNRRMSAEQKRAYSEEKRAIESQIRNAKLDYAEATQQAADDLMLALADSQGRAKSWRESEKQRVAEILHNANSDMMGISADVEHPKGPKANLLNGMAATVFAPAATMEQFFRLFGRNSVNGEGYLFNRFMRGWQAARDNETENTMRVEDEMNAKVHELGLGKRWSALYSYMNKPIGDVAVSFDGKTSSPRKLSVGNALLFPKRQLYRAQRSILQFRPSLRRMEGSDHGA